MLTHKLEWIMYLPLLCSRQALRPRCPFATNQNHPVQLEHYRMHQLMCDNIDIDAKHLQLSSIFQWFGREFQIQKINFATAINLRFATNRRCVTNERKEMHQTSNLARNSTVFSRNIRVSFVDYTLMTFTSLCAKFSSKCTRNFIFVAVNGTPFKPSDWFWRNKFRARLRSHTAHRVIISKLIEI